MKKIKISIKELILILLGNFILAIGVGFFILPSKILSGGLAGVAVLTSPFLDIPSATIVSILTITLFFIGLFVLGKEFAFKTLISSFMYPFFLNIIVNMNITLDLDPFLSVIYGGFLGGFGVGIVLKNKASTGGMDIPILIVQKFTKLDLSFVYMVFDAITVILGLFIFGLEDVLLGLLSVVASSYAIKLALNFPNKKIMAVNIISEKYIDINSIINDKFDRGTTIFEAKGGYTNSEKKVILVCVNDDQYVELLEIIHDVDDKAFVIASEANNVFGEGFALHSRV